jgi:hypothetical protein
MRTAGEISYLAAMDFLALDAAQKDAAVVAGLALLHHLLEHLDAWNHRKHNQERPHVRSTAALQNSRANM